MKDAKIEANKVNCRLNQAAFVAILDMILKSYSCEVSQTNRVEITVNLGRILQSSNHLAIEWNSNKTTLKHLNL